MEESLVEFPFPKGHTLVDGRYQIRGLLGQGGMSIVQKAFDRLLKIEVAIKFLTLQDNNINVLAKANGLFMREARIMAKLAGHSNIASILNIGTCLREDKDYPENISYIVIELLPNGSAEKFLEQEPTSKIEKLAEILKICIGSCDGLTYAHQQGILHRDIKPSNILIGLDGNAKVSDFGIAKVRSKDGKITAHGAGTERYMAPEQSNPDHYPDEKIDVWQLGITFYQLLTGNLPPKTRNSQIPNIKPNELNELIPSGVSNCIMAMLSEEPSKRPTCKEVGERLKREFDLLDPQKRSVKRQLILELPEISDIRQALRKQLENGIQNLVDIARGGFSILPKPEEQQKWYTTILVRASTSDGNTTNFSDYFSTIFFAEYLGAEREAVSDWETDTNLVIEPLPVSKCASGFPIRWYTENSSWTQDQARGLVTWNICNKRFLKYIALRQVKWARFVDDQDNLIKNSYASDDEVGWKLKTKYGERRCMSEHIETEILIPVYDPLSQNKYGSPDSIIAVANFEWDESFSNERLHEIGSLLSGEIQDSQCFALNGFMCNVLQNIVPLPFKD